MIQFDVTARTAMLTRKIIDRLANMDLPIGDDDEDGPSEQSIMMDFAALKHSYPDADLKVLLESEDFDFVHDVYGIARHMDRSDTSPTGGKLLNCFYPRFMRTKPLDVQELGRGKRIKA